MQRGAEHASSSLIQSGHSGLFAIKVIRELTFNEMNEGQLGRGGARKETYRSVPNSRHQNHCVMFTPVAIDDHQDLPTAASVP